MQFEKHLAAIPVKWYLPNDATFVEDELATYVWRNNDCETPAHSFVLDTQDPEVHGLFTVEQLETIDILVPKLPEDDSVLEGYFKLFENVSYITYICSRFQILVVRTLVPQIAKRRQTVTNFGPETNNGWL